MGFPPSSPLFSAYTAPSEVPWATFTSHSLLLDSVASRVLTLRDLPKAIWEKDQKGFKCAPHTCLHIASLPPSASGQNPSLYTHKKTLLCRLWVFLPRFTVLVTRSGPPSLLWFPRGWPCRGSQLRLSSILQCPCTEGLSATGCSLVSCLVYRVDKGIWGVFLTHTQRGRFLCDMFKTFYCFIFSFHWVLWLMQPWGRKSSMFPTETLCWPNCSGQLWAGTAELLW